MLPLVARTLKFAYPEPEARDEATLAQVATQFRVVLFGAGKTLFAPPNQPALQVLLQYRNLYEAALRDVQIRAASDQPIPTEVFNRTVMLLDKMWSIIYACMQEHNKATFAKAKLLSAERVVVLNRTPVAPPVIPNPGHRQAPNTVPNPGVSEPTIDEPIVLEPECP